MSTPNTKLTLFLLGALAFTTSALPGVMSAGSHSTSLSSNGCSLQDQLNQANTASCTLEQQINGQKISGKTTITLVNQRVVERRKDDPEKFVEKTAKVWEVNVESEAECNSGCLEGKRRGESQRRVFNFDELGKVAQAAEKMVIEANKKLADEAAKDAALVKKKENCEADASGNALKGERERLACRIEKLGEMDREKAADYFDQKIQPVLENLASSNNAADHRYLNQLLNKGALASSRNPFIATAMGNLKLYSAYTTQAQALRSRMLDPFAANQEKLMARQQMSQLNSTFGTFLAKAGYDISRMQTPSGWSMDFAGSLTDDLSSYRQSWDSQFASIASIHNQYLSGQQTNPQGGLSASAGNGRTLRGQPAAFNSAQSSNQSMQFSRTAPGTGVLPQQQPSFNQQNGQFQNPSFTPQNAQTGLNARRMGAPVR